MSQAPIHKNHAAAQAANTAGWGPHLKRTAALLQWLIVGYIVVAGLFLVPRAALAFFGALFGLADAAGAPGSSGFHFADLFRLGAWFVWLKDAPLLELLALLVAGLIITRLLYKIEFYTSAIMSALAVFVITIPFALAEIYFTKSGASLPLSASSSVNVLTYRTLSGDPHVESRYGLDKNHVYCSGQVLQGANPKMFALVPGGSASPLGYVLESYAKDDQHVWWDCNEIPNADPASIRVMSGNEHVNGAIASSYATDAQAVYFQGQVIPDADPSSYERLTVLYAKDKNHVWVGSHLIPGANPTTFQILDYNSHCYEKQNPNCLPDAKDDKQSYLHGQNMPQ